MLKPHPQFIPPQIILDSVNASGDRLTTFKLRYPKMVHGDFMTHRVFSRNASSSRAIPTARLSVSVAEELYVPQFRENRTGMQAGDYLSTEDQEAAAHIWRETAERCITAARNLVGTYNVHKQWANRMLEWFGYITVVVSATSWKNFIGLRDELGDDTWPMAQDEIYWQATGVRDLLASNEPKLLNLGQWHLPFIRDSERQDSPDRLDSLDRLLKISAARCASTSYETVDGKLMDYDRALAVYDKLVTARRMHASPLEHQAAPDPARTNRAKHGNFTNWIQHRKLIPGECILG